jgi:CMP-N-acetylneuraminic acid synthetase
LALLRRKNRHKKTLVVDDSGTAQPLTCWEDLTLPRQHLKPSYQINGAIYIFSAKFFVESMDLFYRPLMIFEMGVNESQDIDTIDDFNFVRTLIVRGLG